MKHIIVACGTGMATSTIIADKIRKLLDKTDIKYDITQCILSEIKSHVKNADLIVTSTKLSDEFDVPVVIGIPLLIGINEKEIEDKIIEILSK
ncbi:PTS sugar transporter subunit IIB [Thermoanaerobacterium thermosaccharolyticum]|uniref:PTS sugar transporter subunit IIB n=1 Tax=Thermoanaerobacterium thermosaccharolyticum TaxID=1517 RepID=UPI003D297941